MTLGTGLALISVFALVFSVAFGTRSIAGHASALHNADEALRSATIARSQAGLAAHLAFLEQEFGIDDDGRVEVSAAEARLALDDLNVTIHGLIGDVENRDASVVSSARGFAAATIDVLTALEGPDALVAQEMATDRLNAAFVAFSGPLVVERDRQAAEVASADALMGRVGDLARFLVAFLIPTAAIVVFRELSRRQQRQTALEVRLETERQLGKARDDFVANASHELRTPLTSVLGLAHLLEESECVSMDPMAREMTGLIISEANDLSRMVDDLLTTARLDAGALHFQFENLDPAAEIGEVVGPLARSGTQVGVYVRSGLVRSDRLRLRQVVRNLLSNARKYGGANIRVVGGHVSGWYEIRVEDDGEGIPVELRARLFQRYLHEGDMPLVLGSVGLGLSIVRGLSEGMGGAVWYERRDGWTSFVVRVPLATDDEPSEFREVPGAPSSAASAASAPPR